jgi:Rab-like protein 5
VQVANFLGEMTDNLGSPDKYRPTIGVRVLEFERDPASQRGGWGGGNGDKLGVELWDVSGEHSYEGCWPAIVKDAQAVVIMYSPENKSHEQEVALWHEWFCKNQGISDDRCLVYAHQSSGSNPQRTKPPKAIQKCPIVHSSFDTPPLIREEFDKFIGMVANAVASEQQKEDRK